MKYFTLAIIAILVAAGFILWKIPKELTVEIPDKITIVRKPKNNTTQVYNDILQVRTPLANATVTNPIHVTGNARGPWFFEGSFGIEVLDQDNLVVGSGFATAESEWMTEDFVPFSGTIVYATQTIANKIGSIVFHKENVSDLPENDDSFVLPIIFDITDE